jgi:hypothetical protein
MSKKFGRIAAMLAVSSLLIAQGALASARHEDGASWFARAKQIVVKILDDIGVPKG